LNIVDYAILLVMGISIIAGVYNGFVLSALNTASFFFSWLGALIFYPLVSDALVSKFPDLFLRLEFYADGASKIPSVEDRTTELTRFTQEYITELLQKINLPNPFSKILAANAFSQEGAAETLGQYFDFTIASVIVNILSFLILFLVLKLVFTIAISLGKSLVSFPVLKQFDSLCGGCFGLVRGIFVLYFIFALMPIVMALAPVEIISKYMDESLLANIFYKSNIFTSFVNAKL